MEQIVTCNVVKLKETINRVKSSKTSSTQKFDEKRIEVADNIEKLEINSAIGDINIFTSNSSNIEIHFHGEVTFNGNWDFDVKVEDNNLKIISKFIKSTYSEGNLKLDIGVPNKVYKLIFIQSFSANITLSEDIVTECLEVKTISGNLKTEANICKTYIDSLSGDIDFCINATKDIKVEISTVTGDVIATFNNIKVINLISRSMTGYARNEHREIAGYSAKVEIVTRSGGIKIK